MKPINVVPILLALVGLCRTEGTQTNGLVAPVVTSDQDSAKLAGTSVDQKKAVPGNSNTISTGLEGRMSDRGFINDIVDRLHALDADIGKLLYNSTSMYAPDDQSEVFRENQPKGGERFTEVLADLDALQDELGGLMNNATRTRQYNMLVRLRPLNTIMYRIRHNLQLMRNSLVAVNTVASLERLGNSVLDSTLQAFLQPDSNATEEFGDDGNYDIDLNKPIATQTVAPVNKIESSTTSLAPTTPSTTTTTTTTTTMTTTTPKPTTVSTTTSSTTGKPTRRATRPPNRRGGNRPNQRRNSTSTTTTPKPSNSSNPRD